MARDHGTDEDRERRIRRIQALAPVVAELVRRLGLAPHPEGGFYREIWRSLVTVQPADGRGSRSALTVIHYLLPGDAVSRWHRVRSDEVWQYCAGAPLELFQVPPDEWTLRKRVIGEQDPVVCVPSMHWQAAKPTGDYTLVTCSVAPGFEFVDFALLKDHPDLAGTIARELPEAAPLI